jgi:hypothetical protein
LTDLKEHTLTEAKRLQEIESWCDRNLEECDAGLLRFAWSRSAAQKAFSAQVFIEVWPVNAVARRRQFSNSFFV